MGAWSDKDGQGLQTQDVGHQVEAFWVTSSLLQSLKKEALGINIIVFLPQKNTCIQEQFYIKLFLLIMTFLGCFEVCIPKKAAVLFISHLGIASALLYQQQLCAMFAFLLTAVRKTGSDL